LTLDPSRAHRGRYALHARIPRSADGSRAEAFLIHKRERFPAELHGRVFVYLPGARPPDPWRPEFLGLQGEAGKGISFSFPNGTMNGFIYSESPGVTGLAPAPFPTDAWACVRFHIVGAGAPPSSVEGFIDGGSVFRADSVAGLPPLVELHLGLRLEATSRDVASDLWLDDLVVARSPPRCDD